MRARALTRVSQDVSAAIQLLVPRADESGGFVLPHHVGVDGARDVGFGGAMRVSNEVARRRVVLGAGQSARLGPVLLRPLRRGALVGTLRIASNITLVEVGVW
jgi:hypothetical protein